MSAERVESISRRVETTPTRYGEAETTDADADRAVALFRRIERRYGEDDACAERVRSWPLASSRSPSVRSSSRDTVRVRQCRPARPVGASTGTHTDPPKDVRRGPLRHDLAAAAARSLDASRQE